MIARWFGAAAEVADTTPQERVAPWQRIYAIGDIHGRLDLLEQMVARIARDIMKFDDERAPQIVFLGDYIDRGDNSQGVIEALRNMLVDMPDEQIVLLKGNHEAMLLEFLRTPSCGPKWFRYGGLQTLFSYGISPPPSEPSADDLAEVAQKLQAAMGAHVPFLENLHNYWRSDNVVFVHAGLDPSKGLTEQDEGAMLWGRSGFIDVGGYSGFRVIHGHYDAIEPHLGASRICLDTGAYYTGRLTAMRFDSDETLMAVDTQATI